MPVYTERFSEVHKKLATIYPASYAAEQNTSYIDMSLYHRIVVIVSAGNIGTSLDVDIEIATDTDGTALHTLKSITQLTQAGGDDDSDVCIEIQAEELSKPTGASADEYRYLRVELTPSGASLFGCMVFGVVARYYPADVTNWDEVVD